LPGTKAVIACCSFCAKPNTDVDRLVGGPGVYICDQCVGLCRTILEETPPGPSRPLPWQGDMTLDHLLAVLPTYAIAGAQVERNLTECVRKARELGATWARIGETLGMTRQSAWERFSGEE
jgi:hypothetical protein